MDKETNQSLNSEQKFLNFIYYYKNLKRNLKLQNIILKSFKVAKVILTT